MANTFLPRTDQGLLAWANNFSTLITGSPTTYGLTLELADAFNLLVNNFSTALAACDPGVRNKSAVLAKNAAKVALKDNIKLLANIINGQATVTDSQKAELGLNIRATPKPIPVPTSAPALEIVSVVGWTVKIRLHGTTSSSTRGRPAGAIGATICSFVGPTPPADMSQWMLQGNVGKSVTDFAFPTTVAGGSTVWFTAFWFNGRKQSGPACAPVSTCLQGGSVQMAA